jgi:hypothetical protein
MHALFKRKITPCYLDIDITYVLLEQVGGNVFGFANSKIQNNLKRECYAVYADI